jgi:hypothetical protein
MARVIDTIFSGIGLHAGVAANEVGSISPTGMGPILWAVVISILVILFRNDDPQNYVDEDAGERRGAE